MGLKPLPPEAVYRRCAGEALAFATSADVEPWEGLLGQDRALEALSFGATIPHDGYNIFVLAETDARAGTAGANRTWRL